MCGNKYSYTRYYKTKIPDIIVRITLKWNSHRTSILLESTKTTREFVSLLMKNVDWQLIILEEDPVILANEKSMVRSLCRDSPPALTTMIQICSPKSSLTMSHCFTDMIRKHNIIRANGSYPFQKSCKPESELSSEKSDQNLSSKTSRLVERQRLFSHYDNASRHTILCSQVLDQYEDDYFDTLALHALLRFLRRLCSPS